jgi:hypothetical protein
MVSLTAAKRMEEQEEAGTLPQPRRLANHTVEYLVAS